MKFREIFRFEFVYQARRVRTWFYVVVLFVVAYLLTRNAISAARSGTALVNSPYAIASRSVISGVLWLLVASAVAGTAAARDIQTRMHPLVYTSSITRTDYLGGRLLAACALHALILLVVPAGMLLALLIPGVEAELLGSFRPASYITAYALLALPTAFAATTIQFSIAASSRRAVASYPASVLLFITGVASGFVGDVLHKPTLATLLDPIGFFTILGMFSKAWTPIEKNTILIGVQGAILASRAVWLAVAFAVLAFTHYRFRFAHPTPVRWWNRRTKAPGASPIPEGFGASAQIVVPHVVATSGFVTHARQTLLITRESFAAIARSRVGLVFLVLVPIVVGVVLSLAGLHVWGVPLVPRTERILALLTSPLRAFSPPWMLVPLLTVFWAGELVWRERDTNLDEIIDATPVPEWVLLLGKFLGLGLILIAWAGLLAIAAMLVQLMKGYHEFEIELYLQALLGLQLADYLLFAILALAVHVIVGEKHLAYVAALIAYGAIAFAPRIGIEHNLLIYGSGPGWSYSDIRGFGPSLRPWAWLKVYWTMWALLLILSARLFWVRGKERGLRMRLRFARERFVGPAAGAAAAAVTLIIALGGFVFYNTNVLNPYETASRRMGRAAEYERRYGGYGGVPQPRLADTTLRVEIYPDRRRAEIQGTYRLVNDTGVPVPSLHLASSEQVETGTVSFDRRVARAQDDEELRHRIYDFEQALQPGEALRVSFEVRYQARGFRNDGADASVVANGSYFRSLDWLPAIGYQRNRGLSEPGARKEYGLAPRPLFASLDDAASQRVLVGGDRISFAAIVGTDEDQIAVAPGTLRRTWTQGGRRYFQYSTDAPINNRYGFFSARYAVHQARWQDIAIEVYHHPRHARIVDRIVASARAALEYYTHQFGPYPYHQLRLIENPTRGMGAHAEAATIDYGDEFSLLDPGDGPQDLDLVLANVGHEVSHQWWGMQVTPAAVEGAGVLDEGLAMYSAMQLLEHARGPEQLRRYRLVMQEEYREPRARAARPLLRARDEFDFYRRAPFALYALREYIGKERVDEALRRLVEKHGSGAPPLATSRDLYRELQAVTPDASRALLRDLFEANTLWDLKTERATAQQTAAGNWQVTLDVRARKVVVDEAGIEKEVPMDDLVQVGAFAARATGEAAGKPLYLQQHRIRSGAQTITVMVPSGQPVAAGIDPDYLLPNSEGEILDNVAELQVKR